MSGAGVRALPRQERRALLPVMGALLTVWLGLKVLPADRLARIMRVPMVLCDEEAAVPADWRDLSPAHRAKLRVLAALLRRRPFRSGSRCLQESLTIGILFRRDEPRIRLGVAREGDALRAHAWVEAGGRSFLADPAFVPLAAPLAGAGSR